MMNKLILCLLLSCLWVHGVSAQVPTFNFRSAFGGTAATRFTALSATDSCYYVTGIIMDSLPPYFPGNFFAKFDLQGKLAALKVTKDSLRTFESWRMPLFAVDTTFWVGGHSFNFSDEGDDRSAFLLHYTKDGGLLDMKFYSSVYAPDETNLSLQAIVPNPMGGFTMLGVIGRHGNTEYFKNAEVFGLDSDGNVLWRRAYGDESDEWPISLVLLPNGHFLVGISKDEEHTYLLELDGTGEPVDEWLSPDSLGKQMSCELLPTSDGGLLVGTGQDNRDPKAPYGEYNELIYKLDASRQVLWSYRFEEQRPTPDQYTVDMVEALDGSGYVGCNYGEQFSNTVDQYADVLGSVWKLSPTGELMWRRAYRVIETNNSKHSFDDLAATPDGGYILCGYSQENYTETAEMPLGQGWLLKLDEHGCLVPGCHEPTAVNVPEAAPTGLRLHPNPVQAGGQLAVQVVGTGGAGVFRIFDALGREWLAAHVVGPDGTTYLLPTEELPAGTYFLTYENRAGAVASARFVLLGG